VGIEAVVEWLWGPDPIVAVQRFFGPGWVWVAEAVSRLGSGQAAAVAFAVVYWSVGRRLALRVLAAVVLGTLVVSTLWPLFGVERPQAPAVEVRVEPGMPSFPSGHVLAATTLWGSLAMAGLAPLLAPLLAVPLVGLARLILGAHYVGDVLFAVPIGIGVLLAHRRLFPVLAGWIGRMSPRGRFGLGVGGALLVLPAVWFIKEGWLVFGAALGAGLGLPAEPRFVGYVPTPVSRGRQALKIVVGLGVLGAIAAPLLLGIGHGWPAALVGVGGVLWVVLGAPALFVRLGWAGSSRDEPPRAGLGAAGAEAAPAAGERVAIRRVAGTRRGAGAARRSPVARRRAALAIAAEAVVAVALTLWLFPSLWAVGQATVDIDQSAGPEVGVTLTEVANHPAAMWGRTVTISGRIAEVVDAATMIIGNDAFFVGDKVPVVSGRPGGELAALVENPAAGALREGEVVRVTGVVRPLEREGLREELGVGPVAALMNPDERAVLAAEAIELDPPEHLVAGDKEFPGGGSGYEVGATINDVVARPEEYLGRVVAVSDEIDEPELGPHAFVLGDEQLPVVMAEPNPEVFVEASGYVVGEVVRFDRALVEERLGIDLDDEAVARFEGGPALVARSVEVVA